MYLYIFSQSSDEDKDNNKAEIVVMIKCSEVENHENLFKTMKTENQGERAGLYCVSMLSTFISTFVCLNKVFRLPHTVNDE